MKYVSGEKRLFSSPYVEEASLQECLDYCNTLDVIGVDTETSGKDPYTSRVISAQFGDENRQYVIDTSTILLSSFKPLMEDSSKLFLFQNAQFDLQRFYRSGIYPKNIYDTLLVEAIIKGGLGDEDDIKDVKSINADAAKNRVERKLSLDALVEYYCDATLDKSIRNVIQREGLTERVIYYAGEDVKYLPIIRQRQLEIIEHYKERYGIDGKVVDLENEVVKVFARMVFDGVTVESEKYRKDVIYVVKRAVNDALTNLDETVHNEPKLKKFTTYQKDLFSDVRKTDVNWNSSQQKLKILRQIYPDIENTAKDTLRKEVDHPIGEHLLSYNKNKKLESNFGESLLENINPVTKRIHPTIWQILATGRISMKKPNLLQVPAKGDVGQTIRSCFVPREGYKMVGGDYSSFELAVIAEFSQDPLWLSILREGKNLHTELCKETFNIPDEKVKTPFPYNPEITYRDVQKTINFGLSYGMTEHKLANTIGVSKEHAKEIIDYFFSKVPKVKEFLDRLGYLGKKRGYIKVPNPYGRIRFFPKWDVIKEYPSQVQAVKGIWLGQIERESKNTPIQGINAEVIKLALVNAQHAIDTKGYDARILLSIYDELQTECIEDQAEKWKEELQTQMLKAARVYVKSVPVEADCGIADHWTK